MKRFYIKASLALLAITAAVPAAAQIINNDQYLPADFPSAKFHAGRRQALRDMMPANSVAVIFAASERKYANDVNYVYHPDPDFFYFTGYREPDAVLLVFKEAQTDGEGSFNEVIFVRKRDAQREQWTGKRMGIEGAKAKLGFKRAYNGVDFAKFPIELKKFTIIHEMLPEDVLSEGAQGDLKSLLAVFKDKAGIKPVDREVFATLDVINKYATPQNLPNVVNYVKSKQSNPAVAANPLVQQLISKPDSITLKDVKAKIAAEYAGPTSFNKFTTALRGIKTPEEVALIKKSVEISSIAHLEVMKAIKPQMSEREVEGILTYVHKKYGAESEGYPPIVGAGNNGCILHYIENDVTQVNNQLVLMDVGAEYHGYSADVTRTVPANGKFTEAQKAIYQLVYDAQEEVFKLCKAGVPYRQLEDKTQEVLAAGLIKLGIIKDAKELRKYYPHGVSHHLGLDVHDKGEYEGDLQENMVITVEPGIYIPAGSPCDKKWWDIAVRIEDDILIGKTSGTNLSAPAPRKWQDVEKAAAMKSIFEAPSNMPVIK